jgi:hypothetical protein
MVLQCNTMLRNTCDNATLCLFHNCLQHQLVALSAVQNQAQQPISRQFINKLLF